jgi:hypothetical protein
MSTAAVFLDIEKAFDTIWRFGLLHKLQELEFSTRIIKLIAYFLTDRKFKVWLEGEFSTPGETAAGVPQDLQDSVLATILYSLYINYASPHMELILPCSWTIPVFRRRRSIKVVFSANCNAASLQ